MLVFVEFVDDVLGAEVDEDFVVGDLVFVGQEEDVYAEVGGWEVGGEGEQVVYEVEGDLGLFGFLWGRGWGRGGC